MCAKLYYFIVKTLQNAALAYIRKHNLLKAGDRVAVAVSGGVDSVALLRLLLELRRELGIILSVIHFNHKLRGEESDEDERFVAALAEWHEIEIRRQSGNVRAFAAGKKLSLETAARELRYGFFHQLLEQECVDRIATAHTLDDQAETVLMRVARGAGTRGLAGIYPKLKFGEKSAIVRPLLAIRRIQLEEYLRDLNQPWREDSSNTDIRHRRNLVRHHVLPELERHLNPLIRESLSETAEIARADEDYWQKEITRLLPGIVKWSSPDHAKLPFDKLCAQDLALRRRIVRATAESLGCSLEFRHVEQILELGPGGSIVLPGGFHAALRRGELCLSEQPADAFPANYEYTLTIPGAIDIPEIRTRFEVVYLPAASQQGYNPDDFLNAALLDRKLCVRNWRGGDRFWPIHSKAPKKMKELLQEKHITGAERRLWPVVTSADEIVWVRGFPPSHSHSPKTGEAAVLIRELSGGVSENR